jgi:hypothetical protein
MAGLAAAHKQRPRGETLGTGIDVSSVPRTSGENSSAMSYDSMAITELKTISTAAGEKAVLAFAPERHEGGCLHVCSDAVRPAGERH